QSICADALNFITPSDSPQAGGIMATLTEFTRFFRFAGSGGPSTFSIGDWTCAGDGGFIFISNQVRTREIMKPLLSLFIDLISGSVLSLPEKRESRIFFLIDEAGTLHPLSSLVNLLTYGRSRGSAVFLAVQDFSQLDDIYGTNTARTI